jgi:hypothetical protein
VDLSTDESVGALANVKHTPNLKFYGYNKEEGAQNYTGGRAEDSILSYVIDKID